VGKPDVVRRGQKAHLEPKSIVAEAYRTIRTAVFFGVPKGEAKTILITSPSSGDGKSTIVSNLAIAMAQAGQKTLIIDADFRKPMQHNIFEIAREEKGLADVVADVVNLEEAIQPGPVEGLDVLSCGTEIPNPSEVLNSDAFARLLREFAERYDRVIVDSPPVGPVADSQILSALCDITLLVLRADVSTRRHSQHARDSLLGVGGHLLGAIVNGVRRKHGHYGYYSDYGYYHHYGYYGDRNKPKVTEG
jgi:capsular exopolysaccharide synthesis family protein